MPCEPAGKKFAGNRQSAAWQKQALLVLNLHVECLMNGFLIKKSINDAK